MSEPTRVSGAYPSAARGWSIVAILYIAYMLSFIDRQIIAFLVAPIREYLNITDFQLSLISGFAFAIFYVLLGVPIGLLADRINRIGIVSIGITLWSVMTAACGFAGNYWQLFLARIGVGVGEATLAPCAISLITDHFPREKRDLPINIYSAGVHGGIGLSLIFGGMIVGAMRAGWHSDVPLLGALEPWQATFVIVGLPGVVVALILAMFREPVRQERATLESYEGGLADTFRYMLINGRAYISLIMGAATSALASYGMYAWVPALLERKYGLSSATIGLSFGLITLICGTGGLVLAAFLAARLTRLGHSASQLKILILAMVVTTCVSPFIVAVDSAAWTLGCLSVIVLVLGTPIGLAPAALQAITPNEMRGQVVAIYIATIGIVGLGIGPSAVAAVTDFILQSDAALGSSLAIVMTAASALSIVLLSYGLRAYTVSAQMSA